MATAKFSIDEMHCGSCIRRVSDVLRTIPGITLRSVEVGAAEVEYDPAVASLNAVAVALTQAGYPARSGAASIPVLTSAEAADKTTGGGGCSCCG